MSSACARLDGGCGRGDHCTYWVELSTLGLLIVFGRSGWLTGSFRSLMGLAGFILGLRLGGLVAPVVGPSFGNFLGMSVDAGMVIVFVVCLGALAGASSWVGHRFMDHVPEWRVDEGVGLLKGGLASVIAAFASATSNEHQRA